MNGLDSFTAKELAFPPPSTFRLFAGFHSLTTTKQIPSTTFSMTRRHDYAREDAISF